MIYKILQKNVNIIQWANEYGTSILVEASNFRSNSNYVNLPENTINEDSTNYWYPDDFQMNPQWIQYTFQFCAHIKNITVKCGDLRFKPVPLIFQGKEKDEIFYSLLNEEFDESSENIEKTHQFTINQNNKFYKTFRIANNEFGPTQESYSFRIDKVEMFGDIVLCKDCSTLSTSFLNNKRMVSCFNAPKRIILFVMLLIVIIK